MTRRPAREAASRIVSTVREMVSLKTPARAAHGVCQSATFATAWGIVGWRPVLSQTEGSCMLLQRPSGTVAQASQRILEPSAHRRTVADMDLEAGVPSIVLTGARLQGVGVPVRGVAIICARDLRQL